MTQVREQYRSVDMVPAGSGKPVFVFNVCGNTYRLIVAIHFNTQIVLYASVPDAR
jgi:mRNA-degrading endonuclease HigB of HigAB toxin-antitoxin module